MKQREGLDQSQSNITNKETQYFGTVLKVSSNFILAYSCRCCQKKRKRYCCPLVFQSLQPIQYKDGSTAGRATLFDVFHLKTHDVTKGCPSCLVFQMFNLNILWKRLKYCRKRSFNKSSRYRKTRPPFHSQCLYIINVAFEATIFELSI
jgi:hypothetical protein